MRLQQRYPQQPRHSQEIGSRCFGVRPANRLLPDRTCRAAAARRAWANTASNRGAGRCAPYPRGWTKADIPRPNRLWSAPIRPCRHGSLAGKAQLPGPGHCDSIRQNPRNREATTMTITVCPVTQNFAAEIGDVDLSAPIAATDVQAIKDAFAKYAVLIFPDQQLSQDQHLDFAKHFGPLETTIALHRKDAKLRVRKEFADVSNLDPENEVWGKDSRQRMFQMGNRLWHTDSSFKRLPALASLLYARSIPTVGGHTEFADERAAYDALPEEKKGRLENLVAEHSIFNSRARLGFTNFSDEERA